jgi:hypothetical protein
MSSGALSVGSDGNVACWMKIKLSRIIDMAYTMK